jgi:signal peptidase I
MMTFLTQNFELILFLLVLISGLTMLFDRLFLAKKRVTKAQSDGKTLKLPTLVEYSRSFFPVLLVVFLIRSFVVEPYRIPSGSLKPTLSIGDFIIVNKFAYGLRLPLVHTKILSIKEPKHGDLVVFRFPPNPSIDYVKRMIGLPGDHVEYKDKVLYINGKKMPQKFLSYAIDSEPGFVGTWEVEKKRENFEGVKHDIYLRPDVVSSDFDIIVPKGQYFVMGDNRDNSGDSRHWGFVPDKNLIGQAFCILISWDGDTDSIRWSRIGHLVH